MLMKLTPGVKFINIYEKLFGAKVFCATFIYLQLSFVIFGQKNISAKAAHKILVKLTSGLNLTVCKNSNEYTEKYRSPNF